VREVFEGSDAEFSNAVYLVQVTEEQGIFQYGIGFYNTFVRYFVPTAIVGEEGKERLLVHVADAGHVGPEAGVVVNRYGWAILPYIVPTGPASAFQQFWYFGAVCFYVLARCLKGHWVRAFRGDLWSQAVYTLSAPYAVSAVVNDVYAIYHPVVMFVVPGLLAMRSWAVFRQGSTGWRTADHLDSVIRLTDRRPSPTREGARSALRDEGERPPCHAEARSVTGPRAVLVAHYRSGDATRPRVGAGGRPEAGRNVD
jgi:hypothetical protein